MKIHNARRATLALTATFLTVAGLAYAQQRTPYFRFGSNPTTTTPGSSLPSPWNPPVNDKPLEIGKPGATSYTLRALVGEPINLTMATTGGTAPYTWQPTEPLPANLSFANGIVTGTPTEAAKSTWNVSVRDAQGKSAQGRVSIDIVEPILSISGIRPFARVGAALDGLVSSNVASPSYSMRGMPGATLGSAEANARAAISGTASAAGTFPLTVDVTRPGTSIAATATREVVVENPLEIAFDPPSIPALLEPVSVTISALNVGGTPTLSLTSPSVSVLAARGLSYADGRLTGTLRYGAATNLSLRLRDTADGGETTATLRIPEVINGASSLVIASEMRQGAQAKAATGSTTAATVRTEIPSPRCTTTQAVPGLVVSAACGISGTATSIGDHTLALTIVPSSNPGATPVAVSAPVKVHPALTLTASSTNSSLAPGEPLDLSVTANGVIGKPSFELAGTTPAYLAQLGLSFNATTGAVTGVPDGGVDVSFGIRLRDSHDGDSVVRTVSVKSSHATLVSNVPALNLRTGDVRTFVATTNVPSPTFSLAGAPDYVRIDPRLGVITITAPETDAPLTIPAFDLTVASETREGVSKTVRTNPGIVRPELKLLLAESANGRGNVPFRLPFTTEGIYGSRQIQIVSGTRPPGTDLLATELSGTPTTPGISSITFRLTDTADARSVDRSVRIEIGPSLDIAFSGPVSPPGRGTIDQPFTLTASAQNAVGTVTFENVATASRPALLSQAGLTITPQGVISGTPTAAFNGTINIRMTEVANGVTATLDRPLNLAINAQMTAAASRPQVIYPEYDPAVDIASALMDASGAGGAGTSIYVRNSGVLTYTYPEPVTINSLASPYNGNYTVTNVETGMSYSVNISGGNGSFTAGTSATWRVRQNFDGAPETLALGYNNSYVRAPHIASPSAAIPVNDSGTASVAPPATANVVDGAIWAATGLPPGLQINPSTGVVTGTPTEYGLFDAKIWLTDGRGVPSWPKTYTYNAVSKETAANSMPIVKFNGVDVTKAMLDRDPNGSTIVIPSGDSVEFTYSKPVTADGFYSTGTNGYTLSMTGDDASVPGTIASGSTGTQISASGAKAGGAVAQVFKIRNASGYGLTLREIAPTFGGVHYNVPYVNQPVGYKFNNVTQPNLALGTGTTYDFATGYLISLNFNAYDGVAPLTLSMTDVPPGMTVTGTAVEGIPTTPGIYTMNVSASDSRGVVSDVKRMNVRILPQDTVSTVMPDTLEGTSLPSDRAISALYDRDTWETVAAGRNGASRAIIPVGGSATFTYPKPVQANYLSFTVTGGTGTSYLRVKNGAGEFISSTLTSSAAFNPSSGGTGSTTHIDTTFTVVNTGPNPADLAELRISMSGSTPSVGWVNESFDAKLNGSSSNISVDRRTPLTFTAGLAQSFQNKIAGVAGSDWRITEGTLPPGMAMNSAGLVSGTPTETGTFSIQVAYADTSGRVTMPKPMTFKVLPNASTLTVLPIDIQAPGKTYAEALVALYDNDTYEQLIDAAGPSQVTLANGESVILTYPEPVRANYLSIAGSKGSGTPVVKVSDADTEQVFVGSLSTSGYLSTNGTNNEWSATRFKITNVSGGSRSISMLKLGNIGAPASPTITDNVNVVIGGAVVNGSARSTPIYVTQGTSLRITPVSSGITGTPTWTVSSGSWPAGMNMDAGTGVIEGTPTQVGDFTVVLRVTDSRGQTSFPKTVSIKVQPSASTSTILPIDIQGTGLSYADALAAIYDLDSYESSVNANGPSAFTLANNASVTLTFPELVRASYLSVGVAAGQSSSTVFEVADADTGQVMATVGGSGYFPSNGWNYDRAATRFRLTNKSGSARILTTLRVGNIGTPGTPTLPESVSLQINGGALTAPNRRSAITLLTTQASHRIAQPSTSGTIGSLTWEITSGRLPEGLDIDYSTGTITGKATEVGSFTINVRVKDSRGIASVSKPIILTVN